MRWYDDTTFISCRLGWCSRSSGCCSRRVADAGGSAPASGAGCAGGGLRATMVLAASGRLVDRDPRPLSVRVRDTEHPGTDERRGPVRYDEEDRAVLWRHAVSYA